MSKNLDFDKELEPFIKDHLINNYELTKVEENYTTIKLNILEGVDVIIEGSITNGLEIIEYPGKEDLTGTKYESFEQLLASNSQEYNHQFNKTLIEKLSKY